MEIQRPDFTFVVDVMSHGGIATCYARAADALAARGYRVDILCQKTAGDYQPVHPNIRLYCRNGRRAILTLPWVWWRLQRERPRYVISGALTTLLLGLVLALSLRRMKHIVWLASAPRVSLQRADEFAAVRRYPGLETLWKFICRKACVVVAPAEGVATDTQAWAGLIQKPVVIGNPAWTPQLAETEHHMTHPSGWPNTGESVFIGCGRLVPVKGFEVLIAAFAEVHAVRPAYRLVIVGDGPLRAKLQGQIERQWPVDPPVQLAGQVSRPTEYFLAARNSGGGFVLSSHQEGFGMVLVEAMAVGCPVIATDAPFGPRDVLADGQFGTLVPVGDATALAKAMLSQAQASNDDAAALMARARMFGADDVAGRLLAALPEF